MLRHLSRFSPWVAALLLLLPSLASGQDILPGLDLFETDPATTWEQLPIPADFFEPGSDPFEGTVALRGNPPGNHPACPNDDLSLVDTIVERLQVAPLPNPGTQATIEIEIVALDLVSIDPITVTNSGGQDPQEWLLDVDLDPTNPQPLGTMNILRVDGVGGVFHSSLPVVPRLIFTRVSDGEVRVLNGSENGVTLVFTGNNVPWVDHTPPDNSCTSNFCVNPGQVTVEDAILAAHGVISICPDPGTPTAATAWSTVKSLF